MYVELYIFGIAIFILHNYIGLFVAMIDKLIAQLSNNKMNIYDIACTYITKSSEGRHGITLSYVNLFNIL